MIMSCFMKLSFDKSQIFVVKHVTLGDKWLFGYLTNDWPDQSIWYDDKMHNKNHMHMYTYLSSCNRSAAYPKQDKKFSKIPWMHLLQRFSNTNKILKLR